MSEDVEQNVLVHVDQIDLVQHMVVEQQLDNNVPLLTLITKSELNSSPLLAAACLSCPELGTAQPQLLPVFLSGCIC